MNKDGNGEGAGEGLDTTHTQEVEPTDNSEDWQKGGVGISGDRGSSVCRAAGSCPCAKTRNGRGGGRSWKEDDYFGLEHAEFEMHVVHSCECLNT